MTYIYDTNVISQNLSTKSNNVISGIPGSGKSIPVLEHISKCNKSGVYIYCCHSFEHCYEKQQTLNKLGFSGMSIIFTTNKQSSPDGIQKYNLKTELTGKEDVIFVCFQGFRRLRAFNVIIKRHDVKRVIIDEASVDDIEIAPLINPVTGIADKSIVEHLKTNFSQQDYLNSLHNDVTSYAAWLDLHIPITVLTAEVLSVNLIESRGDFKIISVESESYKHHTIKFITDTRINQSWLKYHMNDNKIWDRIPCEVVANAKLPSDVKFDNLNSHIGSRGSNNYIGKDLLVVCRTYGDRYDDALRIRSGMLDEKFDNKNTIAQFHIDQIVQAVGRVLGPRSKTEKPEVEVWIQPKLMKLLIDSNLLNSMPYGYKIEKGLEHTKWIDENLLRMNDEITNFIEYTENENDFVFCSEIKYLGCTIQKFKKIFGNVIIKKRTNELGIVERCFVGYRKIEND